MRRPRAPLPQRQPQQASEEPGPGGQRKAEVPPFVGNQQWFSENADDVDLTTLSKDDDGEVCDPVEKLKRQEPRFTSFIERMRGARVGFTSKQHGFVTWEFYDDDEEAVAAASEGIFDDVGEGDARGPLVTMGSEAKERVREQNRCARERWLKEAAKHFIARRRKYNDRLNGSRFGLLTANPRASAALVVTIAVLFASWPLWDKVLIDVQSDTHFHTLGLQPGASKSEIKKAYRSLAKVWHPDHNPECGIKCRNQMMKLQEAHDVLLEKGPTEARMELLRRYQESLQHLVGLIFFRGFTMARATADYLAFVAKWLFQTGFLRSVGMSLIRYETASFYIRLVFLLLFAAFAAYFVTAEPIFLLIQLSYMLVHLYKPNPAEERSAKILRRSNFDVRNDTLLIIIPAMFLHLGYFLFVEKYPRFDHYAFHTVMGFTYITAHLTAYTPNLFDNTKLLKCSIPWQYLANTGPAPGSRSGVAGSDNFKVTIWSVLVAELLLVLDDVWAFSIQLFWGYRVAVFGVHAAFLLQFVTLPWDKPILGKMERRQKECEPAPASAGHGRQKRSNSSTTALVLQRVSELEEQLVTQLDRDAPQWAALLPAMVSQAVREEEERLPGGGGGFASTAAPANAKQAKVQVFFHCDLRHVLITVVTVSPGAPAGGAVANSVIVKRVMECPTAAELLAREVGKAILWPDPAIPSGGVVNIVAQRQQQAIETAKRNFNSLHGGARSTGSIRRADALRAATPALISTLARGLMKGLCTLVLMGVVMLLTEYLALPYFPLSEPRYSSSVPPGTANVDLRRQRFTGLLPPDHLLHVPGGIAVFKAVPTSTFFANDPKGHSNQQQKESPRRKKQREYFFGSSSFITLPLIAPDLFESSRTVHSRAFSLLVTTSSRNGTTGSSTNDK